MAQAMCGLKPKDRLLLAGYLHHAAVGDALDQSETTHRNMRRLAQACGLTVGLPVELMGSPESFLDLRTGTVQPLTQLQRVAAGMEM
jgi:hypothetical protein